MTSPSPSDDGVVNIHGKRYKTVALRIQEFRENYPDYGLETALISQAELVTVKATISNEDGRILSTGFAEENRSMGSINKTSAVENAETSAVGRALAFLGLGGTEIASADEVANAISQQHVSDLEPLLKHNAVVVDLLDSIQAIKEALLQGDYSFAKEAWRELGSIEQTTLWREPTQGGVFTVQERNQMKSSEWSNA